MNKFISSIKEKKKNIKYRLFNGYASILALICFSLLIQIMSLVSVYTLNSAYLIQATRVSTFDLSCISHAKHIIENNNIVRRCNYSSDKLILDYSINIMDRSVFFTDNQTYINCSSNDYTLNVYYDEKGVSGIEFE